MKKSLRTQFIDFMTLNRYSPWTMKNYIGTMTQLAKYHNKSPDMLSNEDIQELNKTASRKDALCKDLRL